MNNKEKIGIFGGTFDPIHFGHIKIAQKAKEFLKLNKIIFVPSGNPPHKNFFYANKYDRYNMVIEALKNYKGFIVSDYEIKKEESSYTIDTINHFISLYKNAKLYFISGADVLFDIENWKSPDEIFKKCELVTLSRPSYNNIENKSDALTKKYGGVINIIKIDEINISSTEIREKIKNGKDIKGLVPNEVINYIEKNKLYRWGKYGFKYIRTKA